MTRPVSDAASISHPVAALNGRTNIPLAWARAQEGGTILFFGFLSQAKFRSAHLDPRELIRSRRLKRGGVCFQALVVSAPSSTTPAVTYFQKAISSFRAKATISTFLTRPPLICVR